MRTKFIDRRTPAPDDPSSVGFQLASAVRRFVNEMENPYRLPAHNSVEFRRMKAALAGYDREMEARADG